MGTAGKTENQDGNQGNIQGQQGGQMQGGQMQGQQGGQMQGGIGSPITNEAYNVITALQAKLEGLEAYRKYSKDGQNQVWQKLTQVEMQGVSTLVDELERIVKDGKLRMQTPGKASGSWMTIAHLPFGARPSSPMKSRIPFPPSAARPSSWRANSPTISEP